MSLQLLTSIITYYPKLVIATAILQQSKVSLCEETLTAILLQLMECMPYRSFAKIWGVQGWAHLDACPCLLLLEPLNYSYVSEWWHERVRIPKSTMTCTSSAHACFCLGELSGDPFTDIAKWLEWAWAECHDLAMQGTREQAHSLWGALCFSLGSAFHDWSVWVTAPPPYGLVPSRLAPLAS